MNCKTIPTVLILFILAISPSPLAFADHDDGDDVEEYDYVLRFNQQDISRFVSFISEDESLETSDACLEIHKTIGAKRDPDGKKPLTRSKAILTSICVTSKSQLLFTGTLQLNPTTTLTDISVV